MKLNIKDSILFVSISLMPLQIIAIPARATLVDVSCLLLVIYLMLTLPERSLWTLSINFIGFAALSLISGLFFELSHPVARIAAPAAFYSWITTLYINYRSHFINKTRVISSAISTSILISIGSAIIYTRLNFPWMKLGGLFSESSYASLFYSASVSYILILLIFKFRYTSNWNKLRLAIISILLLYCIILFPGIHPISLVLSVLLLYFKSIYRIITGVISLLKLQRISLLIATTALMLGLVLINDKDIFTRVQSRYDGLTSGENLSSIVYMAGNFQFTNSLQLCPFIGCGSGSPGYLGLDIKNYLSTKTNIPYYIELGSKLNRFDTYSLFFRAIVELGPIIGGILLLGIFLRFYNGIQIVLKQSTNPNNSGDLYAQHKHNHDTQQIAILTWCFVFYIGSLIKEPHLFRSITFTPLILGLIVSSNILNFQSNLCAKKQKIAKLKK